MRALLTSSAEGRALRRLWERMIALYGYLWVNAHGLTPHQADANRLTISGDTWARALSGLSGSQIAQGLARCLINGSDFAPSAPRFRSMCYGIPSLAAVRSELRNKTARNEGDPSSFTRAVWAEMDTFRYRQSSADQADRLLRETYELVVERTVAGVPLPEDPVAVISNQAHTLVPATPEQRAKHIASIQEILDQSPGDDRISETSIAC
ncbi:hypothetical protein L3D22_04935 [Lysobacter soli]|uniref:hypothetical protein n=1 Tax=Lysobacter soli TaxID=453783 RepID=UPI0020A21FC6|nr:hypothetical protein [Lysobacter soli]UTA55182.1 hypothetical protein L3D22_04935 [Lysobacter soli]